MGIKNLGKKYQAASKKYGELKVLLSKQSSYYLFDNPNKWICNELHELVKLKRLAGRTDKGIRGDVEGIFATIVDAQKKNLKDALRVRQGNKILYPDKEGAYLGHEHRLTNARLVIEKALEKNKIPNFPIGELEVLGQLQSRVLGGYGGDEYAPHANLEKILIRLKKKIQEGSPIISAIIPRGRGKIYVAAIDREIG